MAVIDSFKALKFSADKAGDIKSLCCPPYDIISEAKRQEYLKNNPHNIIRLELPKDGENPYAEASKVLDSWLNNGILARDDRSAIYIYTEEFTAHGEKKLLEGIVCRVKLEEFSAGVVLPHEETLSKAKDDRLNLMKACGCNFSSIYSLFFDKEKTVAAAIKEQCGQKPLYEFADDDGVIHRLWAIYDEAVIKALAESFADKKLYIADGHHRYETALNYRNWLKAEGKHNPLADYVMMTLVDIEHPGLVVFPTHRIVRGLESFDRASVLKACEEYFELSSATSVEAAQKALDKAYGAGKKAFALYSKQGVDLLELKDIGVMAAILPDAPPCLRELDVSVLHSLVLERLFKIDKENMANQKNLIYTRDLAEAIEAVDNGEADCSFIINPTRVEEIASVASLGGKMPQKSTYFYPKLITGHLINPLF